ncbi:MAG: ABC transporter permease subunit [Deltaproteobacteria bacterium]|nr:ABC transporter permease subunit [Deltaproteobacteria bacterium]
MLGRVGRALVLSEALERLRDRWVIVVSSLFALLALAVSLYGRRVAADDTGQLTGASLVTLTSLLVPLVAMILGHDAVVGERERNTLGLLLSLPVNRLEVALAKFLGRLLALVVAVGGGFALAVVAASSGQRATLALLIGPAVLLGSAFLSVGVLVSSITRRQITAASTVVALWFVLAIFYDIGLLGLMVGTDGALSQQTIGYLVIVNPVGLFRLQMLDALGAAQSMRDLGLPVFGAASSAAIALWALWVILPIGGAALLLKQRGDRG